MSGRWVYCPLCDGYAEVTVDGKKDECPACKGTGMMSEHRAQRVREELRENGAKGEGQQG